MSQPLFAAPPARVLVLCTRRLGDVLLTTPLLRSLRRAWPESELDVLTLKWSAPAVQGNPDISRVIPIDERASVGESLRALGGWRSYDLALSTLVSDRPHLMAFWAGRSRANLVTRRNGDGRGWKRLLSTRHVQMQSCHTVLQYLHLADAIGIERHYDVVPPRAEPPSELLNRLPAQYAVVHPAPMYHYKRWSIAGWRQLLMWFARRGIPVVLTGGPAPAEKDYVRAVGEGFSHVTDLAGIPGFGELPHVFERAAVFVGPDTSITHLAAATGVPTVALFGPTGPLTWGPWPQGLKACEGSPWVMAAPLQHQGNVWIVQGIAHCVPCHKDGCDRRLDSRADCLEELPASRVIAAAEAAIRPGS